MTCFPIVAAFDISSFLSLSFYSLRRLSGSCSFSSSVLEMGEKELLLPSLLHSHTHPSSSSFFYLAKVFINPPSLPPPLQASIIAKGLSGPGEDRLERASSPPA